MLVRTFVLRSSSWSVILALSAPIRCLIVHSLTWWRDHTLIYSVDVSDLRTTALKISIFPAPLPAPNHGAWWGAQRCVFTVFHGPHSTHTASPRMEGSYGTVSDERVCYCTAVRFTAADDDSRGRAGICIKRAPHPAARHAHTVPHRGGPNPA